MNLRFEKLESVAADKDVAVSVDFEKVAVKGVEPEASDRKGVVVLEVHDGFGVTEGHQPLFQKIKPENLKLRGINVGDFLA